MEDLSQLLANNDGLAILRAAEAQKAATERLASFVRAAWPEVESRRYMPAWHIDAICEHLQAINQADIRALVVMCPPRHSKSSLTTVFWPAWTWLRSEMAISGPRISFAFASWSSALSTDHNMALRRLVGSSWYRAASRGLVEVDTGLDRSDDFRLTAGGRAFATSVNSTVTGFGFDIRVADDANALHTIDRRADREAVKKWYDEIWKSRVEDPKASAEVIIMQRAHVDDLVGHVLGGAREAEFTVLCLPAEYDPDHPHVYARDPRKVPGELLDPNRFGAEGYATIAPATAFARAAQMQQQPHPRGGSVFANADWQFADEWPRDVRLVRWWDKAATPADASGDSDWTAGALGGLDRDGRFWLVDMTRGRWSPHQVEQRIKLAATELDPPGTQIYIEEEPGSSGRDVTSYYQRQVLPGLPVRGDRATGPKLARVDPLVAAAEAGNVVLVRAAWNGTFIEECEMFRGDDSGHDDQVVAAAGCFNRSGDFKRLAFA